MSLSAVEVIRTKRDRQALSDEQIEAVAQYVAENAGK